MPLFNNLRENKFLPILYKLLHDALFVLLLFLAFSLLAEGILPGIIASHFGLSKTIILIGLNVFLITFLGNFLHIKASPKLANKKMILIISFFGILLIINGLLHASLFFNLFLTILAIIVGYLVFSIFSEEKEN
jgi:hypothetical protein